MLALFSFNFHPIMHSYNKKLTGHTKLSMVKAIEERYKLFVHALNPALNLFVRLNNANQRKHWLVFHHGKP